MKRQLKNFAPLLVITVLACCALEGNCAETLFKSAENNQYLVQPAYKYSWFQAYKECNQKDMDLLTIESKEKAKEVEDLLNKIFTGKRIPRFHIGANDLNKFRTFSWINTRGRTPFTYTNWESTEPNNYKKLNERCVHIGFHGSLQWNDINCGRKYGFICQERKDFQSLLNQVSRA